MRIVQINGGAKGSTGKIMLGIADVARSQGHEVLCASPITTTNQDAGKDCGYYRIGTMNTRRMNVVFSRITGFNGCFAWFATLRFLKKIDKFNPDVIHLHNLHDSYINLPMLFGYIKRRNKPVVWTLHDCWSFTGQCPYFTMAKCEKWKRGCFDCSQYKEYPASIYDNTKRMWALKKKWFTGVENMTIVTPSEWLADLVKKSYLKDYPVKVINNGIDLNVFTPSLNDNLKLEEKYVVLFVSFGWSLRKGIDVIVDLAHRLNDDYQIVVVGSDNEIDKLLPDKVISIHRTQDQRQLASIYTEATVFANPTREENYPTVNLEALACGTPVVTFNTGGSPEMLNSKNGVVVPVDDIEALENAIRMVCENNKCNDKEKIVKYAQRFNMQDKFMEYVGLYSSIKGE